MNRLIRPACQIDRPDLGGKEDIQVRQKAHTGGQDRASFWIS
ncbi:MAG: hypothetical protein ACMUIA_07295 [bacterium]